MSGVLKNIDYIEDAISYEEFFENYLLKNRPCLFSSMHTSGWKSRKTWVLNSKPNISLLENVFKDYFVPVVDCRKKYYSSHEKCDMTFSKFCEYWKSRKDKVLYLKDWHCQKVSSGIYEVPQYFQSDWLNEYWDYKDGGEDDYRFVYIGVKDSWTPFHIDVFQSYSWSANICGLKKWILYAPGEEDNLRDKFGELPFDVTLKENKSFTSASISPQPLTVYQREGEIIFVPSGWHHQVLNIEDTISVNHNWINACSITYMYKYLCLELEKVKCEIADCRDMDGFENHCQIMMNASLGIDFREFYKMLKKLTETRLLVLQRLTTLVEKQSVKRFEDLSSKDFELFCMVFVTSQPRKHYTMPSISFKNYYSYILFDLKMLLEVLKSCFSNKEYQLLFSEEEYESMENFVTDTENSLKSNSINLGEQ